MASTASVVDDPKPTLAFECSFLFERAQWRLFATSSDIIVMEFQVLIDNLTDSLSTAPLNVTLEWPALMRAGMRQLSGTCQCCANHGLALVIKAFRGSQAHTVLFDAGPVEFAVEYNGTWLGIEFGSIDAVVLSHGHWDHAGGLSLALELIGKANGGRASRSIRMPWRERHSSSSKDS